MLAGSGRICSALARKATDAAELVALAQRAKAELCAIAVDVSTCRTSAERRLRIRRSEIRCQLGGGVVRSLRQVEHPVRQAVEEGKDLGGCHHVGIFRVHVAQVDGVARLRAVETALFGERYAVIEAEGVEYGCPH